MVVVVAAQGLSLSLCSVGEGGGATEDSETGREASLDSVMEMDSSGATSVTTGGTRGDTCWDSPWGEGDCASPKDGATSSSSGMESANGIVPTVSLDTAAATWCGWGSSSSSPTPDSDSVGVGTAGGAAAGGGARG